MSKDKAKFGSPSMKSAIENKVLEICWLDLLDDSDR